MEERYIFFFTSLFISLASIFTYAIVTLTTGDEYIGDMVGFGILIGLGLVQYIMFQIQFMNVLLFGMVGLFIFCVTIAIMLLVIYSVKGDDRDRHVPPLGQSQAAFTSAFAAYIIYSGNLLRRWEWYR